MKFADSYFSKSQFFLQQTNIHTKNTWRSYSSEAQAAVKDEDNNIINDKEKIVGQADRHEFQAETAELLNIVAKSLYSENEVCYKLNSFTVSTYVNKIIVVCCLKKGNGSLCDCNKFSTDCFY